MRKSKKKEFLFSLLVLGLIVVLVNYLFPTKSAGGFKYYQVLDMFETGKVSEYSIDFGSGELKMWVKKTPEEVAQYDKDNQNKKTENSQGLGGLFAKEPTPEEKQRQKEEEELKRTHTAHYYKIPNMTVFLEDMERVVLKYNKEHPENKIRVDYKRAVEIPWWLSAIPTVLLFGGMAFVLYFLIRQSDGSAKGMSFGKVKARQIIDDTNRVTFKDVAGAEEEKEELAEVVEFLKNPSKFNSLGAKMPKGVLLVGPPGTGKTLLAKAVAGEAGVPFFSISGSDFVEMFVGMGARRVRDLFEQAKTSAPCIVFIDEIDAVGRQRGAGLGGGNDEREQTLNQLLVEMDGFGTNTGVIVIAATNRRDVLDPALLRPGRFDREVFVQRPDIKGREEILLVHARNKPMGPDVDFKVVARSTAGFTGADLSNIVNEAALAAAKDGKKAIMQAHLEEAIIKVMAGPEKRSKVIKEADKRITAYHEAGHAITTFYSDKVDDVHEISIIPRGGAGGYTLHLPEEDRSYMSKGQMEQEIVVLLGGRVAEKVILDDISTGASNDIERVTNIAKAMVKQYGFSDKIGPIVYGTSQDQVFLGRDYGTAQDYSEATASAIDEEVRKVVFKAFQTAEEILTKHTDKLHLVAKYLLVSEKIDGKTFAKIMKNEITQVPGEDTKTAQLKEKIEQTLEENNSSENNETEI